MNRQMIEFIHGNLTYKIIGILFRVYNAMGSGFKEKYYQDAIRRVLEKEKVPFLEQVKMDMSFEGIKIGKYYIDFVINHKVVLEIKSKSFISHKDVRQVLEYLKKSGIEVGLIACFASEGMKIKRLLRGFPGNPGKSDKNP